MMGSILVLFEVGPERLDRSLRVLQLDKDEQAERGLSLKMMSLDGKFLAFFLAFSQFPNRGGGARPLTGVG